MSLRKKTPWQTKAVMTQIYDLGFWGKGSVEDKFYSGDGSHDPKIIEPYIQFVQEFLQSFKEKISLVDLGCGDFNVGKNFVQFTQKYFDLLFSSAIRGLPCGLFFIMILTCLFLIATDCLCVVRVVYVL